MLTSPAMFTLVNTRLILRTGVDLGSIKTGQDQDPSSVTKVLEVLKAMGYAL